MRAAARDSEQNAAPRFRVAALPENQSIFREISERLDFAKASARVTPRKPVPGLLGFTLPRSLLDNLRVAAEQAIASHGVHGWLTSAGRNADGAYRSLSLTYNPDLEDPGVSDVHQSTLGTSVNAESEFYYGFTKRFRKLKNTYFDTYGFRLLTPAAKIGALGDFLAACGLSLVRSRLSLLRGDSGGRCPFSFGWHRDEPVFENLRVNIPLYSQRSFRLQLEHVRETPRAGSKTMTEHYLAPGKAYTFDTHRPHRVFARAPASGDRLHLVLGFSPWLSYDRTRDSWQPNEYFGRLHPFDIVRSGALHPALRA
jgi:hypothetical protein